MPADLPPLAGRDLDERDVAWVRGVVWATDVADAMGMDEALSAGLIGYWRAAVLFDPAAGASWATYAARRVKGAVRDRAREIDHLSRRRRQRVRAGEEADPHAVSLQEMFSEGSHALRGSPSDRTYAEAIPELEPRDPDVGMAIDAALERVHEVHPRAAAVIRLSHEQGWSDREIAELFGVTTSRVSQLRGQAHEMLRELLPLDLLDAA